MQKHFDKLQKILSAAAGDRITTRAEINRMQKDAEQYSQEHQQAVINPRMEQYKQGVIAQKQEHYTQAVQTIDDMAKAATEKHAKINLANPALTNALKLIELSGKEISTETVNKINATFAGDQSALRALQGVYKAAGVVYDGGLEKQIYEPEMAYDTLKEFAYHSIMREGSLNDMAGAVSRLAKLEGIDFPQMIDETGANNVMRRAAGLPVE